MAPNAERVVTPSELALRMEELAAELIDPMICRSPAYGVPGHAHCAACCYGTGVVITCDEDQAIYDAVVALEKAVVLLRRPQQFDGEGVQNG